MLRRSLTLPCTFFALLSCGDSGTDSASQTGDTPTSPTAPTNPTTTPTTGDSVSATGDTTGIGGSATDTATATSNPTATEDPGTTDVSTTAISTATTGDDTGVKFDLTGGSTEDTTTGPPADMCKATDEDMGNVGDCTMEAPPDSFEPDVQWSWDGPGGERESLVTPLVANLTDDNGDGEIDLCDIPDVVVTVTQFPDPGHIYVLSGDDGHLHFMIPTAITWSINPAIGDIDDDGIPEIVAAVGPGFGGPSMAIAFEHDGTVKWQNNSPLTHSQGGAITLADLDNDGEVV